jgi:hypothetical protein
MILLNHEPRISRKLYNHEYQRSNDLMIILAVFSDLQLQIREKKRKSYVDKNDEISKC